MLEVKIEKTFPEFNLKLALTVNKEILSVLGPSGSGKTMTLLCIAGLLRPDVGLIRLNDRTLYSSEEKINLQPQKRKIGFVFQNYALFPHLTVAENITYGMHGDPRKIKENRTKELLELMHIPALKDRYPRELSSGQQQRVALARALAPEPEALLLDEPFSALDTYRRERLEYELMNLQKYYNGDILFVTHDLNQGFKLGERLAVYDSGRIIQCDRKEKVIQDPISRTVARLTGVKNIFEGTVSGFENKSIEIFIPEFNGTLAVTSNNSSSYIIGEKVILGIRPEHIEIAESPGDNAVECSVVSIVDGVSDIYYYYCAMQDQDERYHFECCRPKTGQTLFTDRGVCYLQFPKEKLILMKSQEG